MVVTWYPDAFFLLNAGMDLWLLYLLKHLLNLPGRLPHLAAAACAGAAGSCLAFYGAFFIRQAESMQPGITPIFSGLWDAIWAGVCGWLMIRLAFGKSSFPETMKRLTALGVLTVLSGGILSLGDPQDKRINRLTFMVPAAAGALASAGCLKLLLGKLRMGQALCRVVLYQDGRSIPVNALWDSGNRLYEPYTHSPVHVVTREVAGQLWEQLTGVIYVPYHAVGTRSGILPAMRAERMELWQEGRAVRTWQRPWLAISQEPLSPGRKYEMLLHGEERLP